MTPILSLLTLVISKELNLSVFIIIFLLTFFLVFTCFSKNLLIFCCFVTSCTNFLSVILFLILDFFSFGLA